MPKPAKLESSVSQAQDKDEFYSISPPIASVCGSTEGFTENKETEEFLVKIQVYVDGSSLGGYERARHVTQSIRNRCPGRNSNSEHGFQEQFA
jgi:hypothetical protein